MRLDVIFKHRQPDLKHRTHYITESTQCPLQYRRLSVRWGLKFSQVCIIIIAAQDSLTIQLHVLLYLFPPLVVLHTHRDRVNAVVHCVEGGTHSGTVA